MNIGVIAAKVGDKVIVVFAVILMVLLMSYGSFSLWYTYMTMQEGFLNNELHYISVHPSIIHVVSVCQDIGVGKIGLVPVAHKNGTGKGKVPHYIFIDIFHIVLPLYHRVVNMGIVNGNPSPNIFIYHKEILEA